ncbi:ABC transporter permease [Kitasatospora phosalacinea]|uniref:ABC transporter permease n=1 Tax=Kitasatospora phosalacinea TaxID=2065 RepID=UPI00068C08AF|nr:FtsX-like permease family protein [Kitasatospora phosalacinea]
MAIYSRGLGLGEALLPGATVAAHSTSPYPARLLVAEDSGADRAATAEALSALAPGELSVTDRQGYAAQADRQRELSGWANDVMAAVLAGFAALTAADTLVMTVLDRRREIALLRLAGTTHRQVRTMLRWEALLTAAIGLATGAAIAWTTLAPLIRALTSASPHVLLGTALPLRRRSSPALPGRHRPPGPRPPPLPPPPPPPTDGARPTPSGAASPSRGGGPHRVLRPRGLPVCTVELSRS